LSFRYGHFPYLKWRESVAMDHSFWSHTTNHFSDKPLSRLPGQNPS
jgi:hypothetical protein